MESRKSGTYLPSYLSTKDNSSWGCCLWSTFKPFDSSFSPCLLHYQFKLSLDWINFRILTSASTLYLVKNTECVGSLPRVPNLQCLGQRGHEIAFSASILMFRSVAWFKICSSLPSVSHKDVLFSPVKTMFVIPKLICSNSNTHKRVYWVIKSWSRGPLNQD